MKAKQTRPFIGINADFLPAGKVTSAHARLNAGYFEAVVAAGGLPVILPPLGKGPEINALLDRLDGVLLSGGLDMDPRRQQQPSHPSVQPMSERREESDRIMVRACRTAHAGAGIGVGMHQINGVRRLVVPAPARGSAAGPAAPRSFRRSPSPCRPLADRLADRGVLRRG